MSEIDRIFSRFVDSKPAAEDRREVVNVPRRGATGSRAVEVVHVRSGAAGTAEAERKRRTDFRLRAATWEGGFPAKQAVRPPEPAAPLPSEAPAPTAHLMPAWEPTPVADVIVEERQDDGPKPAERSRRAQVRGRGPGDQAARRVADPFDSADEGANCMRCGYAIEAQRERQGLMTCAACA